MYGPIEKFHVYLTVQAEAALSEKSATVAQQQPGPSVIKGQSRLGGLRISKEVGFRYLSKMLCFTLSRKCVSVLVLLKRQNFTPFPSEIPLSYSTSLGLIELYPLFLFSPSLNQEELKRAQETEREKRAAAAERRMAAATLKAQGEITNVPPATSKPRTGLETGISCSCCGSSLAGKVPFHRYNYRYCSTSCMHVHREMLEDG